MNSLRLPIFPAIQYNWDSIIASNKDCMGKLICNHYKVYSTSIYGIMYNDFIYYTV